MFQEKPQLSTGHTTVDYNGNKVLEGKYNCRSESRAGFDKDRIHVEVQNKLVPVGADYVHGYEYGAPRDGSNAPTVVGASNKSATPIKSTVIYSRPALFPYLLYSPYPRPHFVLQTTMRPSLSLLLTAIGFIIPRSVRVFHTVILSTV